MASTLASARPSLLAAMSALREMPTGLDRLWQKKKTEVKQ